MNALLASSIRVNSTLHAEAFQRAVVSLSAPRIGVSLCHVSFVDYAHEVISAGLKDTVVSLTKTGDAHPELDVTVATSLQVYVQNFVQLLNVSVLPQVNVHAMVHATDDGVTVSTIVDPIALYLSHTAMLILSTMDKILAPSTEQRCVDRQQQQRASSTALLLDDMRITLVNRTSRDVWFRQEGTSECLEVAAHAHTAYSWLSLASMAYYRMEFAVEKDESQSSSSVTPMEATNSSPSSTESPPTATIAAALNAPHSVWSDPVVIRENCVTGRYFPGCGFLWIGVELKGLQTVVTLRPPVIFRNLCDHTAHVMLNDETAATYRCESLSAHSERDEAPAASHHHNTVVFTTDAAFRVRVSQSAGAWSAPLVLSDLPPEFSLVRSLNDAAPDEKSKTERDASSKREFVTLRAGDTSGADICGWLVARRAECKTVLPNDFDLNQRHFAQRYAWMELALWPALAVENCTDMGVSFAFVQQVRPDERGALPM